MPRPQRSTREVITLLTAATGLLLAGQSDAEVEILPGSPTTAVITSGGKARATFILPVPRAEACRVLGRPVPRGPDPELDRLWAEENFVCEVDHAG